MLRYAKIFYNRHLKASEIPPGNIRRFRLEASEIPLESIGNDAWKFPEIPPPRFIRKSRLEASEFPLESIGNDAWKFPEIPPPRFIRKSRRNRSI